MLYCSLNRTAKSSSRFQINYTDRVADPNVSLPTTADDSALAMCHHPCDHDVTDVNPHFVEFLHTERRYLKVLEVIVQIKNAATSGEKFVGQPEEKVIFGNISAIASTHSNILKDIDKLGIDRLEKFADIIIKYKQDLLQQYPQFCSGFEEAQKMLQHCSQSKPGFKKFLEEWKNASCSGREHLSELLIRPIQRLGSVSLLLKEIWRSLPEGNHSRMKIENALKAVMEVLSLMNEDKERTEKLCAIFETYNSIIDCPAYIIAARRTLHAKFYADALTDTLAPVGSMLVFFLFCDIIEVARVRKRVKNFILNSEEEIIRRAADGKPYKHVATLSLNDVRRVIDIKNDNDVKNALALVHRSPNEMKETFHCFEYKGDEQTKTVVATQMARCIALLNPPYGTDVFITSLFPHEVFAKLKTRSVSRRLFTPIKNLYQS